MELKDYIQNNELDLDRIVDNFSPYVRTIVNNMVGNNLSYEDKEEILSDTFFILWKNRNNNILSLNSYIAGITKNLVKEKLKKKKITYNIIDYENLTEYSHFDTYSDERFKLQNCVHKLKNIDKTIFIMFYYSSKSVKDIASKLNITEFNVTTRLYRIRKRLRKELKKENGYE